MEVMSDSFTVEHYIDGGGNLGSGIEPIRLARKFARSQGVPHHTVKDGDIGSSGYTLQPFEELRQSASAVDIRILNGDLRQCDNQNNESLVVYVRHAGKSFLFAGDAEWEAEACVPAIPNMLARFSGTARTLLDVDVYKVSHHGSYNGTNRELLLAMSPEISVISTGHHTTQAPTFDHAYYFGEPRERTVRELKRYTSGRRDQPKPAYSMQRAIELFDPDDNIAPSLFTMTKAVYCTCWDGDIVISVNDSGKLKVLTGS